MSPYPDSPNLISFPYFDVDEINSSSLFWQIHASHPFFTVKKGPGGEGIRLMNYFRDPVVLENGIWGSRIFLEKSKRYVIKIRYRSPIELIVGLYRFDEPIPAKFWQLRPKDDETQWEEEFDAGELDCGRPFHIKIIVQESKGEAVELFEITLRSTIVVARPEITVGIVTYNRKEYVKKLLGQIDKIDYPLHSLNVVVIDNASTDGTAELIATDYPSVTVVRNKENLGGAGGFNTFFRYLLESDSMPPYAWLIDDDARIDATTLGYLVQVIETQPSVGVVGSVMMDLDHPKNAYEAGGSLFADRFGWNANLLHAQIGALRHHDQQFWEVGYAGAYSLLFRTEVLPKVGIWKNYFLHVDDSEWCYRIQKLTGMKVVVALDSLIWHVLQGQRKPFTSLRYYETRNFLDFFAVHGDGRAVSKVLLQCTVMAIRQLVIRRYDLFDYHIRGVDDFFRGRYGRADLPRTAVRVETVADIIGNYRQKLGTAPKVVYLVREINAYINDGVDHERWIAQEIRRLLPNAEIVEARVGDDGSMAMIGDRMMDIGPSRLRIVTIWRQIVRVLVYHQGIVILPFWNEAVVPNNLGRLTAVYESGAYSLYWAGAGKVLGALVRTSWQLAVWVRKARGKKYDVHASEVKPNGLYGRMG